MGSYGWKKLVLGGEAWTNRKILVYQNRKLRSSAPSKASCLFFQLLYGQLRMEKSVSGGKAWTNRKILVYQNRKMMSSARSKASCLFFQLLYGQLQLRLEKSVLGGEAWTNRKILVYQNRKLRSSAFSAFRSKLPIFPAFVWAVTAGKIGFRRRSLDKQKDPSLSK